MQKTIYSTISSAFITLLTYGQAPTSIIKGSFMTTDAGFGGNEIVVAQNIETGMEIKTKKGEIKYLTEVKASYTLKVPPGKYFVYQTTPNNWDIPAYYTEFVTCGLSAECISHKKIIVNATIGKTISKIDPQDNYYTDPKQLEGNTTITGPINVEQKIPIAKPVVIKDSLIGYWEGAIYDKNIADNDELGVPYDYFGMYPKIKIHIKGVNLRRDSVIVFENDFDDSQKNLKNDLSVKYKDSFAIKLNMLNDSTILIPYYQIDAKDTCQGNAVLILRYDIRFKGLYLTGVLKGKGANCDNYRFSFRKINRIYFNYYDSLYKTSLSTPDKTKRQEASNPTVDFSNKSNSNSTLSSEELRKKEEQENRKKLSGWSNGIRKKEWHP